MIQVKKSWYPLHVLERLNGVFTFNLHLQIFTFPSSNSATVRVSYAYVRRNDESGATPEIFYTRQLTYPMTVTVYHMLECHDMSVMPLDAFSDINDDSLQRDGDPHEWCLFSIEVRNTYGLPFEVTFDRTQQGEVEFPPFVGAHSSKQMHRMLQHARLFHPVRRPGKSNHGFFVVLLG